MGECTPQSFENGKDKIGRTKKKLSWHAEKGPTRTHTNVLLAATQAMQEDSVVHGMKRVPVWSILPYFDLVQGIAIDIMHLLFVKGVYTLMLKETLRILDNETVKSIYTCAKQLKVQQTHDSKRKYRSIEDSSHFKAEEVLTYTCNYMLPVLCNVAGVPAEIIKLWSNFSELVELLCKSEYSAIEFDRISILSNLVPDDMETLFTKNNITFKVHLLRHVPESIQYLGPLKLHWCFSIENLLSFVRAMVHGRLQMDHTLVESIKHYSLLEALESFNNCTQADPSTLLSKQLSTRNRTICLPDEYIDSASLLGKCIVNNEDADSLIAFYANKNDILDASTIKVYSRALINDTVYHFKLYSRAMVRQSWIVEVWFPYASGRALHDKIPLESFIGVILGYVHVDQIGYAIVQIFDNIGIHAQGQFRMVSKSVKEKRYIVQLSQIRRKCVMVTPTKFTNYALHDGTDEAHTLPATRRREYSVVHFA
jgi:hypothetical protein